MRSVPADSKKKNGGRRSRGRHKAPSQFGKLTQRAGRFAPALAVLGVLATAPHGIGQAPVASARLTAGQLTAGQVWSGLSAGLPPPGTGTYWGRHASIITLAGSKARAPRRTAGRPVAHRHRHPARQAAVAAPAHHGVVCSGTGGMLPDNYAAIVTFLMAHGYTGNAAAGIAGNIYQESGGNPESIGSGGGGLIGWTPLPAGYVTGNPAADLQTQLSAILSFNQIWAGYIPALNAAASPAAAADIYVTDFERAGIPAAGNREAAATAVATACGI